MHRILILVVFCFLLIHVSAFAQDWAQLKVFQEANQELKMTPSKERIVFYGNSITIGWLHTVPSFFKDKPFINRGIGGQTTPQMLVRFRQDVLDLKPKVVLILAGTNDIAGNTGPMTLDEIMGNLRSMAELAMANNIEVILCSVLPASDYPWRPGLEPNRKIPALNTMIKEYTEQTTAHYLDYYSALVNDQNGMDSDLANDGVHPTKAGYEIMAPLAIKAIEKALN
ncbi:MAG: acylhydrolase [Eudoraea sp.]|nr:acylhydrolase [Eudoraea sp.]